MSKPLVLTCDIGTQSARALLVDPDGRIVDVVQSKYAEPYFSKEPGWAEQKPNFYFDRLCECCRELCARSNALLPDVIAMTITVIRDTVVCLDANNEPLRDIILWLDKRTVDPNGAMPAKNMMLFKVAGMEPTAKVVYAASVGNWIMRHEPEIWARTAKYVMLPTYLNYKLTGNLIDSASNQIGHIPFDYKNRRWMKPGSLTRCFCDVPNEKLCDLVPSGTVIGTVTDEVCALTGIPAGLPLISTGSDKGCETLGLAVVDSDKASISLGTTATIQFSTTEYVEPQQFLPAYPGVLNDHYNPEIEIYRGSSRNSARPTPSMPRKKVSRPRRCSTSASATCPPAATVCSCSRTGRPASCTRTRSARSSAFPTTTRATTSTAPSSRACAWSCTWRCASWRTARA